MVQLSSCLARARELLFPVLHDEKGEAATRPTPAVTVGRVRPQARGTKKTTGISEFGTGPDRHSVSSAVRQDWEVECSLRPARRLCSSFLLCRQVATKKRNEEAGELRRVDIGFPRSTVIDHQARHRLSFPGPGLSKRGSISLAMFISPPVLGAIAPLQLLLALALADSSGSSSSTSSTSSTSSSSSIVPTKNYIDTISGYDDLSTCAENVLSTIVRAQSSGCGDNGALTSYSCFCTDSSSHFSYEITSAVSVTCDSAIAPEQASSAIRVFDAYCALGVEAGLAKTTARM